MAIRYWAFSGDNSVSMMIEMWPTLIGQIRGISGGCKNAVSLLLIGNGFYATFKIH